MTRRPKKMLLIMDIIRGIRNIRGEMNIVPSQKVEAIISVRDAELASIVEEGIKHIKKLANVSEIKFLLTFLKSQGRLQLQLRLEQKFMFLWKV